MNKEINLNFGNIQYAHKITDENTYYSPRCTNEYEIFICVSGNVKYMIDGRTEILKSGDLVLVDRLSHHSAQTNLEKDDKYERIIITFPEDIIQSRERKAFLPLFSKSNMYHLENIDDFIDINGFEDAFNMPETIREIAIEVKIKQLLIELFAMSPVIFGKNGTEIEEIIQYIDLNLGKPLTLEIICDTFHLSKSTLSRRFLKATGSTVNDYILFKRMALAKLMLESGTAAQIVSEVCGYLEYSTFYRNFLKVYKISPSDINGQNK